MLKKYLIFITLVIIFFISKSLALENKILIKVDNEIVTTVDIFEEIDYLNAVNRNIQKLQKNKIFEIAKNSLIKKKIKEKEINKYMKDVEIDQSYIDQIIVANASKLGFKSVKDFNNHLSNFNLSIDSLKPRILNEILWNELVVEKYSNKLVIDEKKIKSQINSNKEINKSYLLSEIVFDLSMGSKVEEKYLSIQEEIEKNGFENAALIYSISDTSSTGGKLGWIKETSMSEIIKEKISNLQKEEYTNPVKISGGFLILKINDIKETVEKIDIKKETEKFIRNEKNRQLNQFSLIYFNKIKRDTIINEL